MRIAFLLPFVSTLVLFGQVEQGVITGSVTDQSGAIVPRARVTVTNTRTGVSAATRTSAEGYYTVPYLTPSTYEVTVEADGFKRARTSGVSIRVGSTATVNVEMEVGTLQSEVKVVANAVQLEQQHSALGNVVTGTQMTELPLSGRNPYSLVTLAAGVMPAGNSGTGPIINGGRSNTSEVMFDGAESRNSTTNDIQYTPPLEAVQEFKVITNNFSSEYGRSGGGVLTAASRGGTNQLHGSLYEFVRNDKFNANGWTNNRNGVIKPPFRRNEYGFSIGGPVSIPKVYDGRNKTFFFVNYEQVKQRSPNNVVGTVPTELQRQGNFAQTVTGAGALIRIYDPSTTRPDPAAAGLYTRDPFPANQIPVGRFDPISLNILKYYPLPTRNTLTQNEIVTLSNPTNTSKLFLRFDQSVGARHRLFFSLGRQNNVSDGRGLTPFYPGAGVNSGNSLNQSSPRTYVLSDTIMIQPNLLAEVRGSVTRNIIINQPYANGFDFTQLGFPQSLKAQSRLLKFPRIEITDVDSLSGDRASFFNDTEWSAEAQVHLTWIRGAHSLKTGFDRTFSAFNVYRPEQPSGQYSFSRTFTQGPNPLTASTAGGFGVATFLLGAPSGGQFSLDPSLAASQKYHAFYLQDDWKIRRDLTLNLGMRWEYASPWTDRFNQLSFFDPGFTDPQTGRKGQLRFVGRDGNPRTQTDPNKTNFAPRVGLAWQFARNMVLRSGYGMFFFPGSGGVGAGASDLGSGFLTQTSVYLGPPPAAPNTPPAGGSISNAFVTGLLSPPTNLIGSGVNSAFRNWRTPLNQMWNLSIQRTLPAGMLLEGAYAGSRGMRYWVNREHNSVNAQFLSLGTGLTQQVPNPFFGVITTGGLSAPTVAGSQLLRPFPQYTGITQFRDAVGDSVYHALTLSLTKRTTHGLTFQANYTLSKEMDNAQERFASRASFIDPNNLRLSRAIAEWDRPQYLVLNYIYELPFGAGKPRLNHGLVSRIAGNWQVSGVSTFGAGLAMVVTSTCSTNLPGVSCTPVRLKDPVLDTGSNINRYFDTTAYAVPAPFSMGSGSRTEPRLRTPGVNNFDIGISRSQKFREQRISLQFRAEMFGAFNHTQLGAPNGSVTSPDFGRITSASGTRTIQFGLRLAY
ncbi:MAG: TonB-dependent receptor [Candidatus Solibacter usitatus]|nr:TonB-dependent receptor [Candidatus Solibacter usitatus]